mmetsp:Transcript_23663/g.55132  ORF Transcript_23663/g.55132 Transcript_23663/m.55132 type:complete len:88 (+) Transcript_23663:370-633(+)
MTAHKFVVRHSGATKSIEMQYCNTMQNSATIQLLLCFRTSMDFRVVFSNLLTMCPPLPSIQNVKLPGVSFHRQQYPGDFLNRKLQKE